MVSFASRGKRVCAEQWVFRQNLSMRNLVPSFISDQYDRGCYHGRFDATSIFIDISGFTATTNALMQYGTPGAEVMAQVMRAIFNPLVDQILQWGGFVTNFAGDAFTALFVGNTPETHRHALQAALGIQQYMRANPIQTTSYGEFPFAVKIGVASGETEWGIFEPEQQADNQVASFYFSGEAVDACAKAEHQANAGDLIVTATLCHSFANVVFAEPINGHFRVKSANTAVLNRSVSDVMSLPPADNPEAFVLESIRQQVMSGEFRSVLTLFLQLVGIETHVQLAEFVRIVFRLQAQYGGYLNTIDFGDKGCTLLLFWGMPTSYENDVARALNFVWSLKQEASISFRAGVTYRVMYAGFVGADSRQEYSCYGRGVNLAARFMVGASKGDIWLDMRTARQADKRFEIESLGRFAFKGFSQKQPVYKLLEPKVPSGHFFEGRLVGRDSELRRLEKWVSAIFEGNPAGTTIIRGEAGIGKSRLVHALQNQLDETSQKPFKWLLGQTDQILQQSLNPFRYLLQNYFNYSPSKPLTKEAFYASLEPLLTKVTDKELVQELRRTHSFLAAILGVTWPDSLYTQLEPKARFENTLHALRVFFQAESTCQPLIIQIEDVQWLDNDSLAFIEDFRKDVVGYPIALLLTSRPGVPPKLREQAQIIELGSLKKDSLSDLTLATLGNLPSPTLLELLEQRTDGNPFFVEQTLRYLDEQNLITDSHEGLHPVNFTDIILPTDLRTILTSRIDRLAPTVKETVQTAAILGREFEISILEQIQMWPQMKENVWQATQAGVWVAMTDTRYLFKHALLRDAAYGMQLVSHRRQLHEQAAIAIEKHNQDNLEAFYGTLAYHYEQAIDTPTQSQILKKAATYLRLAGEQAQEAYQNSIAIDSFSRLLSLIKNANQPKSLFSSDYKSGILTELGKIYTLVGEWNEAETTLISALPLSRNHRLAHQNAQIHYELGRLYELRGQYELGMKHYNEALAYYETTSDYKQQADTLTEIGVIYWRMEKWAEAQQKYTEALYLLQNIDDLIGKAKVMGLFGILLRRMGDYQDALEMYQEALRTHQEIGDTRAIAGHLGNIGFLYWRKGDYDRAIEMYSQALELDKQIGSPRSIARHLGNLGLVHRDKGEYEIGLKYCLEGIELAETLDSTSFLCTLLIYNASILFELGRFGEASRVNKRGLELAIKTDYKEFVFNGYLQDAKLNLALGDEASATKQLKILLNTTAEQEHHARLYYELWLMTHDYNYARMALNYYQQLLLRTPDREYEVRITELIEGYGVNSYVAT